MRIAIIGTGYVGLVSGVCLAKIGHEVICVDKEQSKIDMLNARQLPIYENGLAELLKELADIEKISFSSDLAHALQVCDVVFIAVGTPQDESGKADLSAIFLVASEIALRAKADKLVIVKSTVPPSTCYRVRDCLKSSNSKVNFRVASNPEFLREGNAIADFMAPDLIVLGSEDEASRAILNEIYLPFAKEKLFHTDIITAELIKYSINSFLATKVGFINQMADCCESLGANIKDLSRAIGQDSRVGHKFLNPGPGFGGSCFPKDILALLAVAKEQQISLPIIESVISSNSERCHLMVKKIVMAAGGKIEGKKIAFLGLAFKAETDDVRYSPAIRIIKELTKLGAKITAHDYAAIANAKIELKEFSGIGFGQDEYEALDDADLLVVATEWPNYRNLDLAKVKAAMKGRIIIDLRNLLDEKALENQGFAYYSIGRRSDSLK